MAHQTGTATSLSNLLSQLSTFAQANGWTEDELNTGAGKFALHKGNVYVSFRWDTSAPNTLSVHQALGYTGGNEPGNHPNDSGNGFNTSSSHADANLDNERCVHNLGNGPFPHYAFFENDSNPAYLHVVVEKSTDVYRHFGFGNIFPKLGNWTGGEYAYGQFVGNSTPTNAANTVLLDGSFDETTDADQRKAATLHTEGLPGQLATAKWAQVWGGNDDTTPPDDTSGVLKLNVQGGYKGGPVARQFAVVGPAGATSGLIPMYPIALFFRNNVSPASGNESLYLIGYMPDVRGLNIRNFAPKEEVMIGGDTWVLYPQSQKTSAVVADRSYNAGIAYKKVTA